MAQIKSGEKGEKGVAQIKSGEKGGKGVAQIKSGHLLLKRRAKLGAQVKKASYFLQK